jgi:hypothetical protein
MKEMRKLDKMERVVGEEELKSCRRDLKFY